MNMIVEATPLMSYDFNFLKHNKRLTSCLTDIVNKNYNLKHNPLRSFTNGVDFIRYYQLRNTAEYMYNQDREYKLKNNTDARMYIRLLLQLEDSFTTLFQYATYLKPPTKCGMKRLRTKIKKSYVSFNIEYAY